MQKWYLGRQKVSLLERCPQFRGVLIERFHCTIKLPLYLMMLETVIWPSEGPGSLQFNYIQCMVLTTTVGSTGENMANSNSRDQSLTGSPTDYTSEPSLPHPHHDQPPPPLNEAIYTTTNGSATNGSATNETATNGSATNGSATAATQDMGHLVLQGQAYRMTINMAYGSLPTCNNMNDNID